LQFGKKYPAAGVVLASLLYAASPPATGGDGTFKFTGKIAEITLKKPVSYDVRQKMRDYCKRINAFLHEPKPNKNAQDQYTCKLDHGNIEKKKVEDALKWYEWVAINLSLDWDKEVPDEVKEIRILAPKSQDSPRVRDNRILH
jgi:hypothetical protein